MNIQIANLVTGEVVARTGILDVTGREIGTKGLFTQ